MAVLVRVQRVSTTPRPAQCLALIRWAPRHRDETTRRAQRREVRHVAMSTLQAFSNGGTRNIDGQVDTQSPSRHGRHRPRPRTPAIRVPQRTGRPFPERATRQIPNHGLYVSTMGNDVRVAIDSTDKSMVLPPAHVPSTSQSDIGAVHVPDEILTRHRHDTTQRAIPPPGC